MDSLARAVQSCSDASMVSGQLSVVRSSSDRVERTGTIQARVGMPSGMNPMSSMEMDSFRSGAAEQQVTRQARISPRSGRSL